MKTVWSAVATCESERESAASYLRIPEGLKRTWRFRGLR